LKLNLRKRSTGVGLAISSKLTSSTRGERSVLVPATESRARDINDALMLVIREEVYGDIKWPEIYSYS